MHRMISNLPWSQLASTTDEQTHRNQNPDDVNCKEDVIDRETGEANDAKPEDSHDPSSEKMLRLELL